MLTDHLQQSVRHGSSTPGGVRRLGLILLSIPRLFRIFFLHCIYHLIVFNNAFSADGRLAKD
jgi:hypothetical protein